jgi:branched-chain amino acid transport system ATP-binding protein
MLKVENLDVFYGDAQVLRSASIEVGERECVAIMGPNGAGKTTLLRTIAGAVRPKSGSITFHGAELAGVSVKKVVRSGVVLVPEGRHVFPALTIRENLMMGSYARRDRRDVGADVEMVYELFPVLKEKRNHLGRAMSGGEQQMLAIGRGLMARPKLLLLDEPSLGLAPRIVKSLPGVLRQVARTCEAAILIVEQNASVALNLAGRGYLFDSGRVQASGTSAELKSLLETDGAFVRRAK